MKRVFLRSTVLLLSSTVLLASCASIVSKSTYPVHIRTNPAGATVSITDKKGKEVYRGQSPTEVQLKSGAGFFSKAEYQVKLSSPSFADKVVPVNYKLNGWYFGNLLFGGVVGMLIIDPATGAMWRIQDPIIDESLVKETASTTARPTLNIVDIKDVAKELKPQLVRIN